MCKYLPKVHLHTESHQDRFRNKKVFSCVPLLLWKRAWSNGVCKMSHFEARSRNFTARKLIFEYFVVQSILSKSYYRHFSIRPFICMRDGLKDAKSVPPYCGLLYYLLWCLILLGYKFSRVSTNNLVTTSTRSLGNFRKSIQSLDCNNVQWLWWKLAYLNLMVSKFGYKN